MNAISPQMQRPWTQMSNLFKIRNEPDYDLAMERLNSLIDEVGTDERHPLYSLLDTLVPFFTPGKKSTMPCPSSGERICCNSSWRSTI